MEFVTQIEKIVDILSFLLSKIPPDFDGEGSWLTNSLQVFISELQNQQKINVNDAVDDEKTKLLIAGPSYSCEDSAILDESLKTLEENSLNNHQLR